MAGSIIILGCLATVSPVLAWASPGTAVKQAYDRTKDFWYGMLFGAYSY